MTKPFSPRQTISQFKDQISSDKRKLCFLFGAGTSMSVGIAGVTQLTDQVSNTLKDEQKKAFDNLVKVCDTKNIEVILNKLRLIRELIDEDETTTFYGITGKKLSMDLDSKICSTISNLVSKAKAKSIDPHLSFANWLFKYQANRVQPVEIFTTNYDLLFEEAFEEKRLPYFDGFVGSINPFLVPESIDAENNRQDNRLYIPNSWLRFWKIHGSINWLLFEDLQKKNRITRNSQKACEGHELMIYPSRQKYDESRRLPFLVFQDRLRKFLSQGEIMLVISGYSFNDMHINEILFQALRANKRLAITALVYGEGAGKNRKIDDTILQYGVENPNLTVLGPDKACIGSHVSTWEFDGDHTSEDVYWEKTDNIFSLGDFKIFCDFLKIHFLIAD